MFHISPNLKKRLMYGSSYGFIAFLMAYAGGIWLLILTLVLTVLMIREWIRLVQTPVEKVTGTLLIFIVMANLNHLGDEGYRVWLLFLIIWAVDIGAYGMGSWLKGPKLWPRISPNKTWAGVIGGVIFCALILFVFEKNVLWALPLTIIAQSSDLMISAVKRQAGVKDTGGLIPGHGGVLDRFDAFLLTVPFVSLFPEYLL